MVISLFPNNIEATDILSNEYKDYIVIRDYFDLYEISANMAGKYVLLNDIDLTEALEKYGDLYNKEGWIALGYSPDSSKCVDFTGTFDGNGHSIKGLNCNGIGAGLFWSNKGTIKDLTISSGEIQSKSNVIGAVTDYNYGTIENCHNYANVIVGGDNPCMS